MARDLAERDKAVLARIGEHRFLTTSQVQRFVFTGHASLVSAERTARRVLGRLERAHLLRRVGRRLGGYQGGSSPTVWQLAPAGARLIRPDSANYRSHEPSQRFLAHCLAVADADLALHDLTSQPDVESVTVEVEPGSWRRYTGLGGEARWLQPDLAATVRTADYEDRWFIEVDLGTESLATLLRKCRHYETYRASGQEQSEHGVFPLVLWLLTTPERAERLHGAVDRTSRLTPELYRYATWDDLEIVLAGGEV